MNGSWSPWSQWFPDCAYVEMGTPQTRSRECNNPPPINGGLECEGHDLEEVNCPSKIIYIAQRFQKLIYLHLFTDFFMMTSPLLSEQTQLLTLNHLHILYTAIWREFISIYKIICINILLDAK